MNNNTHDANFFIAGLFLTNFLAFVLFSMAILFLNLEPYVLDCLTAVVLFCLVVSVASLSIMLTFSGDEIKHLLDLAQSENTTDKLDSNKLKQF